MKGDLFTDVERLRANDSVYQCEDEARLWLWLRNVCRVECDRKRGLGLTFVDGSTISLAVAA